MMMRAAVLVAIVVLLTAGCATTPHDPTAVGRHDDAARLLESIQAAPRHWR